MAPISENSTHASDDPARPLTRIQERLGIFHPLILDFCRHWLEIRHGKPVPLKRDIDPMAIPTCLPHVWLYRYDPLRDVFICRLAGEEINLAWGRSIKGRTLREIVGPDDAAVIHARWRHLLEQPAILHGSRDERLSLHQHKTAERLILPLTDRENGHATYLIGISIYQIADEHDTAPVLRDRDILILPCREI